MISSRVKKISKRILLGVLILFFVFAGYFFIGQPPQAAKIDWGVNFSQKHSQLLGLDWQENYLALLDDLKVKNIKLITQWDLLELEKDQYNFDNLDWQIGEAEKRGTEILLVIGMKTGRWPECHVPVWAKNLTKEQQQKEILELLEEIVLKYRGQASVWAWQVENEPFFPFGECPWQDKNFLKEEIDLIKSLDNQKRPIVISDSGEGSFWISVAKLGDMVGTTMYKKIWFKPFNTYINYPLPASFYWRKAEIIRKIFNKKVIVVELQAEPWGPELLYESPLSEQEKTMNLAQFSSNIEFAKKTGFDTFYLWGAEWWYWLKEKQGQPEIWEEIKILLAPIRY